MSNNPPYNYPAQPWQRSPWVLLCASAVFAALVEAWAATLAMDWDLYSNYNTALRVVAGQLPFRDFDLAFGPLAPLVLGAFLALPVTGGLGYVIASVALNMAATAMAVWLVSRITRDRWATLLTGTFTAVWFVPPTGGFYHDQLAYAFVLFGLNVYFLAVRWRWRIAIVALAFVLAGLSKQTIGPFGVVALLFGDLLFARGELSLWSGGGWWRLFTWLVAWTALAIGVIAVTTDFDAWWTYWVVVPIEFARAVGGVSDKRWEYFVVSLIQPFHLHPLIAIAMPVHSMKIVFIVIALSYALTWVLLRDYALAWLTPLRAGRGATAVLVAMIVLSVLCGFDSPPDIVVWLALLLMAGVAAAAMASRAANVGGELENCGALMGIGWLVNTWCTCNISRSPALAALGMGVPLGALLTAVSPKRRRWVSGLIVVATIGSWVVVREHRFELLDPTMRRVTEKGRVTLADYGDLWPIRSLWLQEFMVEGNGPSAPSDEIAQVIAYLAKHEGRCAHIDDKAYFYCGLLRRPDWQSSPFFRDGVCVPADPARRVAWQQRMISSLERNDVRYIVYCLNTGLADFRALPNAEPTIPLLVSYLHEHFEPVLQLSHYQILRRR